MIKSQHGTVLSAIEVFDYAHECGIRMQIEMVRSYAIASHALNALSCICLDFSRNQRKKE